VNERQVHRRTGTQDRRGARAEGLVDRLVDRPARTTRRSMPNRSPRPGGSTDALGDGRSLTQDADIFESIEFAEATPIVPLLMSLGGPGWTGMVTYDGECVYGQIHLVRERNPDGLLSCPIQFAIYAGLNSRLCDQALRLVGELFMRVGGFRVIDERMIRPITERLNLGLSYRTLRTHIVRFGRLP